MKKNILLIPLAFIILIGCKKGDSMVVDPLVGKWEQVSDFPGAARLQAASFVIGEKGYIGSGSYGNVDFYSYDPKIDLWEKLADLPVVKTEAVAFAINGKGYVITGINNPGGPSKEVWEYDPAADSWTRKNDFPGTARYDAAGFSIGNKGYLGTGFTDLTPTTQMRLSDWWEYDSNTDSWTQKNDFPGGACNLAAGCAIGSKGYLGIAAPISSSGNQWWQYEPTTDTWARKAAYGGKPRYDAGVLVIDNFCYVGNGGIGTGNIPSDFLFDWWKYDINEDKWTQVALQPNERYGGSGFSIGGFGYFGLGFSNINGNQNDFWKFLP